MCSSDLAGGYVVNDDDDDDDDENENEDEDEDDDDDDDGDGWMLLMITDVTMMDDR